MRELLVRIDPDHTKGIKYEQYVRVNLRPGGPIKLSVGSEKLSTLEILYQ